MQGVYYGSVFLVLCFSLGGHQAKISNKVEDFISINNTETETFELQNLRTNSNGTHQRNCNDYFKEEEYILLRNGSLMVPEFKHIYEPESFFIQNQTAYICESTEDSISDNHDELHQSFSVEFTSCGHLLIDPDEYKLIENDVVYIELYNKTYDPRDYYMTDHGVYICIPEFRKMKNLTENETVPEMINKFGDSFTYVTYFGLVLSIVSLLMHLMVFCIVSSVRNLPNSCLASLSVSLLMAYVCFIAAAAVSVKDNDCVHLGMCIYYFFMASFFWMNTIAFDVWRSFRIVTKELRISSHRVPWKKFLAYSIYSWGIPALLTILVKLGDSTDLLEIDLKPSFGSTYCWFGKRKSLLIFFATPLILLMLLNVVFFVDVAYVINRATLKTSHTHESTLRKRFFIFMKLALIMGLTWIVGLVAGYANTVVLWYLFIILNTLQGLFIFAVFSCGSKVREKFCRKYGRRETKRASTSIGTISQISAAV